MESNTFINKVYDEECGTAQVDVVNCQQRNTKQFKLCVAVLAIMLIVGLGLSIASLVLSVDKKSAANDSTSRKLTLLDQQSISFNEKLLAALRQLNDTRELLENQSKTYKNTELTLQQTINNSVQRELDLANHQENIGVLTEKIKSIQNMLTELTSEFNETKGDLMASSRSIELTNNRQSLLADKLRKHLVDALKMGETINKQSNVTQDLVGSQEEQRRNFESIINNLKSQIADLKQQTRQLGSELSAVNASVETYHAVESKSLNSSTLFCVETDDK